MVCQAVLWLANVLKGHEKSGCRLMFVDVSWCLLMFGQHQMIIRIWINTIVQNPIRQPSSNHAEMCRLVKSAHWSLVRQEETQSFKKNIPSGNQTWQWPIKTSIIRDFPPCHVWLSGLSGLGWFGCSLVQHPTQILSTCGFMNCCGTTDDKTFEFWMIWEYPLVN